MRLQERKTAGFMKIQITAAALAVSLAIGAVLLLQPDTEPEPQPAAAEPAPAPAPEPEIAETVEQTVRPEIITPPEPAPEKVELVQKTAQKPAPPKPDYTRYWKQQERSFNNLLNRLANETDPRKRRNLINALARHIRVDTLATLDWISTLESEEETRTALEAVNKYALVGIGAQIEIDDSGLPLIRKTTIMSAVEATGMVAEGDYISGIVKPDGTVIYFENMPLQQVVKHLRGEVGTTPLLMMERVNDDGSTLSYDVEVSRSLLVVGPPSSIN